ncbi:hypothetical protein PHYBOEH_001760 [Phytophthora boehmeriae]|uniref:Uncharacterized protein n=1 Tax=Phytophthora boehmeriae TaxID=109152 RepID=A0A8T1X7M2_9STRA|nr:hypothetical protein PHYBOEH_001760 [Phytophthora boehmeriae]
MLARQLHHLRTAGLRTFIGDTISVPLACNFSGKADPEDWSDFNNVVKELRNISREQGMGGDMPDTKLLKELGYEDLVRAIRKKHGGVVAVAQKMGTRKDEQIVEMHKKVSARAKRRQKRQVKLNQHDFY